MGFQKLILTIATVVLILSLIVIGMSLSKAKINQTWPPMTGDCPDYWIDLTGNGEQCFNRHRLGTCNIPSKGNSNTMNFNKPPFTGTDGTCAKYKWANSCKVTWDGITSGISNPCTN